ncbi:MAG: S41 family peptidase, partial [Candidatus Bipolaricaulota bacterium]
PCGEQEGEFAQPIVDRAGRVNHGFARAEILLGNVGYLELRHFHPPEEGANTALAAMAFLANVDALIVDLRDSGGGEDTMDHLLVSHLFAEPTHLCTHEYRARGERVEAWTNPDDASWRRPDLPVYVLVGRTTFSAAEGFAYNLQALGRAIVVGERSRGGGHTVEFATFPELGVEAMIPNGRAINPVTGENWEGVGVAPDIESDDVRALGVAHRAALQALVAADEDPERTRFWRWALESLEARLAPCAVPHAADLAAFAGRYGTVEIRLDDDALSLCWDGRRAHRLTPLDETRFEFDGGRERVRFVSEGGTIVAAVFETQEGDAYRVARTGLANDVPSQ